MLNEHNTHSSSKHLKYVDFWMSYGAPLPHLTLTWLTEFYANLTAANTAVPTDWEGFDKSPEE